MGTGKVDAEKSGSITVYFALLLMIMIPLILGCIFTVKVEAGRFQAVNAADQAMYSLFSHYDRSLFEKYDLFFIDGGCQSDQFSLSTCLKAYNEAADPLLEGIADRSLGGARILNLKRRSSSVTSYTLATDLGGQAFEAQALESIKDTFGVSELQQLLDASQEEQTERVVEGDNKTEYEAVEVPEDFENPLPAIEEIQRQSLLSLVTENGGVSGKSTDLSQLVTQRGAQSGFGMINATGGVNGRADQVMYDEYLLGHFSNYTEPSDSSLVSYQTEYLLYGKESDEENLKKVVEALLLRREAINLLFLMTNPEKRAVLEETAMLISSLLVIPEATPVFQAALAAGWAYLESIVDIHSLLRGNGIARLKSSETWQVDLTDIPAFVADRSALEIPVPGGRTYRDYLRILLFSKKTSDLTPRALDMVEAEIRGSSNPNFCIDYCIDSMTIETEVQSENEVNLVVSRSFSYRNQPEESDSS